MATEPEALLAELNAIRDQLAADPSLPTNPEFLAKVHGLAGTIQGRVQEAKANLEAEIQATAADLRAKAAALRKPPPPPPPAEEPFPRPWEAHQGLDAAKLQEMVEALIQLGRTKP